MTNKTILFTSCWHLFSPVGVFPESYTMRDANDGRKIRFEPNGIQGTILDQFNEMAKDVGTVDYLVHLGDVCEGTRANADATIRDEEAQVDAASVMLSKIKYKKLIVLQGSDFHNTKYGGTFSLDGYFASKNGGVFDQELYLKVNGTRFNFKHEVFAGADDAARARGIGDEMKKVQNKRDEYGPTDVVVRGHAHYFFSAMSSKMEGIVVPCYKGKDAFMRKGPSHYVPELGYVFGEVSDKGFKWTPNTWTLKGKSLVTEIT